MLVSKKLKAYLTKINDSLASITTFDFATLVCSTDITLKITLTFSLLT